MRRKYLFSLLGAVTLILFASGCGAIRTADNINENETGKSGSDEIWDEAQIDSVSAKSEYETTPDSGAAKSEYETTPDSGAAKSEGETTPDSVSDEFGSEAASDSASDAFRDEAETNSAAEPENLPATYEGESFYIKDGQEIGLDEAIGQQGCIWRVYAFEVTKELGGRQAADFNYWSEAIDEQGNLTGDESYIFVAVSCENSSGSVQEVLMNSNGFVAVDEAGQLFETGCEARYISEKQAGNDSPEKAFHYVLEDGEGTGIIEIGYIIEDVYMNSYAGLYYCVGRQGSALGNAENCYVKVEMQE